MPILINTILFILAIASSLLIIMFKSPMYKILMVLCALIIHAIIWIILNAEFLAMLLILLYTASFIVLFIFILMILDIKVDTNNQLEFKFKKINFSLICSIIISLLFFMIFTYVSKDYINIIKFEELKDNFLLLTNILFSEYLLTFGLLGLILFLPMIAITCINADDKVQVSKNFIKKNRKVQLLELT